MNQATEYLTITPSEIPLPQMHGFLLGAVAPRPIAFASTVDKEGNPNLAPFSFFNVFSARPPILIFAPNRAGTSGNLKDTVINVQETFEVVINVVTANILQQMNVASAGFPHGVNEFQKAGFTPLPSEIVKPYRVAESAIQMECKVKQIIALGSEGGSGNLIMCEVVKMHIQKNVLDKDGKIDPFLLSLQGRLGGEWYINTGNGDTQLEPEPRPQPLYKLPKPANNIVGYEAIPAQFKESEILSANDLGKLAHIQNLPALQEAEDYFNTLPADEIQIRNNKTQLHQKIKDLTQQNDLLAAWLWMLNNK